MGVVAGALGCAAQAEAANAAARRSMASAGRAYGLKEFTQRRKRDALIAQTMRKRDVEALKSSKTAAEARGRVRVAQAAGGLSAASGSGLAMMEQVNFQSGYQQGILSKSAENMAAKFQSDYVAHDIQSSSLLESQMNQAFASMQNEFLATLTGGVRGLQSDLMVVGSFV